MQDLPAETTTSDLPKVQFDTLSKMLQTLIGLILPLHQLLEAQEGLENTITDRLEEIMESFGTIAASLQITAEALGQILDQEATVSSMAKAMQKMELGLQRQDLGISAIDQNLQLLIDWLGAPPRREAEPNS
jgi:AcrR family transcriptional regulator